MSSILFMRPIFLRIGYSCRKGLMDNQGNNRLNVFWSRSFIERMTNDTPKYFIAVSPIPEKLSSPPSSLPCHGAPSPSMTRNPSAPLFMSVFPPVFPPNKSHAALLHRLHERHHVIQCTHRTESSSLCACPSRVIVT